MHVAARPPGSRLLIDGVVVSNPYEADVLRSDVVHHVSATAGGFVSRDMDARFDESVTMDLVLSPAPVASAPPPSWGGGQAVPAVNRPTFVAPEPGLVARPKRPIEEESPYKQ